MIMEKFVGASLNIYKKSYKNKIYDKKHKIPGRQKANNNYRIIST